MSGALFRQLVRYGVSGAGSVLTYIGLLWLLMHSTPLPEFVANAAAYAVATLLNYLMNYFWSFSSGEAHSKATVKFLVIAAAGAALNSAFVAFFVSSGGASVLQAGLVFAALWPIASFSAQKLWAFRA